MTNYELILNGLKEFYTVNDTLRADLERFSLESTGRSLDQNFEMFAKLNANHPKAQQIIDDIDELNSEPHCITDMEIMYETIDEFALMEVPAEPFEIIFSSCADVLYSIDDENDVCFELEDTSELNAIVDNIRMKKGYLPFFADNTEIYDNGWYIFHLHIDPFKKIITSLTCEVEGNDADKNDCPDNGSLYCLEDHINLDGLMNQFIKKLYDEGLSLEDIQKEAIEEMED